MGCGFVCYRVYLVRGHIFLYNRHQGQIFGFVVSD